MPKPVAHSFKPMFGSHAIYVDDKIVFILQHRDDGKTEKDNGLWIVAQLEKIDSLRADFPGLRRIEMFESKSGQEEGLGEKRSREKKEAILFLMRAEIFVNLQLFELSSVQKTDSIQAQNVVAYSVVIH